MRAFHRPEPTLISCFISHSFPFSNYPPCLFKFHFMMESIHQMFHYDVFLSFRGEDTRKNFTSHLYASLTRHNFHIFHDSSLPRGRDIASQLLQAINQSKIFVVVFSTNYADSRWCLNELKQMIHCLHTNHHQIVLPVFLDVNQSDVATQQASYNQPLINHQTRFDHDTVLQWREALREAAELPGLHLHHDANGDEEELVVQIVERIRRILLPEQDYYLYVADLVGIESRRQDVISLLNSGFAAAAADGVRVVAICGPAGTGKTTVAKATYNRLAIDFKAQYCCFLPDVKTIFGEPNGKITLQKKLISNLLQKEERHILIDSYHQGFGRIERLIRNQTILLVLDDVDDEEQLKILGVNRRLFGSGSIVIVTTSDMSAVEDMKPYATYDPRLLDESEFLEVFCLNAFGQRQPKEGYEEVLREAVSWGERRPGVIKDWAERVRFSKNVKYWRWVLKDLTQNSSS